MRRFQEATVSTCRAAREKQPWIAPALCLTAFLFVAAAPSSTWAQASLGFATSRPFVTGIVPVVGPGNAVGGVMIDAEGVVSVAGEETLGRLKAAREAATRERANDAFVKSRSRKISLARLEALLQRLARAGEALPEEVEQLAGLSHVRHVFVYPEHNDIVLAGPAEGWTIDEAGMMVGSESGWPTLQLCDLVVALRSAEAALTGELRCSIDPLQEGLNRLTRLLRSGNVTASATALRRLESAVGPQQVTIGGVPPASHFALVMVAADFRMKRLAMGLEPSPVAELLSFLTLLENSNSRATTTFPRWWLALDDAPLLRSPDGLAWELPGGVRAMTEDSVAQQGGILVAGGSRNPVAEQWAEQFTKHYDKIAQRIRVFGQLRNCMDLAVVAALLYHHDLWQRAGIDVPLLHDPNGLQVAEYVVPKTVPSQASFVRQRGSWIVSVSGGIQLDCLATVDAPKATIDLASPRGAAMPENPETWWWD